MPSATRAVRGTCLLRRSSAYRMGTSTRSRAACSRRPGRPAAAAVSIRDSVWQRTPSDARASLFSALTTNQKGLVAETAVIHECAKLGVVVLQPMGDQRFDLVLDLGEHVLRIQCKWAVRVGNVVSIRTRTCRRGRDGFIHRKYGPGEIDAIAAYCPETETCYLLPREMSVNRGEVCLRLEAPRNNQAVGINWARDFEFGATIRTLLGP